jgi:hypothetical protein
LLGIKSKPQTWEARTISETVTKLDIPFQRNKDWKFRILMTTDRHIDSKFSDLKLQKKHMQEAKDGNWPIFDIGDIMDAMQGTKDPRSCRSELLPHMAVKEEYFDAVVDYAFDFLAPYAKQFAFIGQGNHEVSVLKHNNTNISKRLVNRLIEAGCPGVMGSYAGWIKLQFTCGKAQQSLNLRYTHGNGGGAPVTKGVIQSNRRAVTYPDAHIVISGHTHDAYCVPIARERISEGCTVYADNQLHVQIMSYKNTTTGRGTGWELEKGFQTQPVGAYWLELWYDRSLDRIRYDARRAL